MNLLDSINPPPFVDTRTLEAQTRDAVNSFITLYNQGALGGSGAAKGTFYPESSANITGDGSEANPYTSADGTAGFTTAIASVKATGRSGKVYAADNRYNISSPIDINQSNMSIEGSLWNYPNDPNGVAESPYGTKLVLMNSSAYVLGLIGSGILGGLTLEKFGLRSNTVRNTTFSGSIYNPIFYPSAKYQDAAIVFGGCRVDQMEINKLGFNNFGVGIYFASDAQIDTCTIRKSNLDGQGIGIFVESTCFFLTIKDNVISDCSGAGVVITGSSITNLRITGNTFVRNAGLTQASAWGELCSVQCSAVCAIISDNIFENTGQNIAGDRSPVTTNASSIFLPPGDLKSIISNNVLKNGFGIGIKCAGNICSFQGNYILDHANDSGYLISGGGNNISGGEVFNCKKGIEITGSDNFIGGVSVISNNQGGIVITSGNRNIIGPCFFSSNSVADVIIGSGCNNTVVYRTSAAMVIVDNGVNTVIK